MTEPEFERLEFEVRGLRFVAMVAGTGPIALCAHGFPETAATFDATLRLLAAAGFRGVAPNMRGYWPSATKLNSSHVNEVAEDLVAMAKHLSPNAPVVLIGHDWGADAAYRAAAISPGSFSRLVTIGIPHVSMILIRPEIAWGLRHFATFQWKKATLRKFRANDFAFVDTLYHRWSPTWQFGPEETALVKDAFRQAGCLESAVAYYWDFVRPTREVRKRANELLRIPIQVPTTIVLGTADAALRPRHVRERPDMFPAGVKVAWIEGVGHFAHREDFATFARILDGTLNQQSGANPN